MSTPSRPEAAPLPVSFAQFIVSLGSSALVHLGELADPGTGQLAPNPPLAQQTIAVLELLRQKTRGNLDEDEARLLDALLQDLNGRQPPPA